MVVRKAPHMSFIKPAIVNNKYMCVLSQTHRALTGTQVSPVQVHTLHAHRICRTMRHHYLNRYMINSLCIRDGMVASDETFTCTHKHTYTNMHTHTHMHTCTHAHMHTYTHAHMHTCTCTHYNELNIHSHKHKHIHTFR